MQGTTTKSALQTRIGHRARALSLTTCLSPSDETHLPPGHHHYNDVPKTTHIHVMQGHFGTNTSQLEGQPGHATASSMHPPACPLCASRSVHLLGTRVSTPSKSQNHIKHVPTCPNNSAVAHFSPRMNRASHGQHGDVADGGCVPGNREGGRMGHAPLYSSPQSLATSRLSLHWTMCTQRTLSWP